MLVWGILVLWWSTIPASNSRDWQPDVAVLPSATLDGDRVTLHNIRNFAYRTATDFTPRYYDKTFDLQQLASVDLISVYWAGEAIAHLMVSFGFGGQDYVAISIETRKERTEDYSSIKGFFKQYELTYVVADERDVIRLRTTYRQPPEEVYLYRTRIPPARARRLFLDYVQRVRPGLRVRERRLDTSLSFADLKQRSHINARAQAAGDAPAFSQRIRADLPRPAPASR